MVAELPFANLFKTYDRIRFGGKWVVLVGLTRKSISQKLLHVELGCMPVSFTWVQPIEWLVATQQLTEPTSAATHTQ